MNPFNQAPAPALRIMLSIAQIARAIFVLCRAEIDRPKRVILTAVLYVTGSSRLTSSEENDEYEVRLEICMTDAVSCGGVSALYSKSV